MIPELGNFALILALLLALIQGTLPIIGAARGIPSWMALARPVVAGAVRIRRHRLRLPRLFLRHQRFLGAERGQNSNSQAAAAISFRRDLGLARRLAAAVDADAGHLDGRGQPVQPSPAERDGRARAGGDGAGQRRLPAVHAVHFQSVRAAAAGRDGRPRPESAAAGSGHGIHPPMLYMGYVGFSVAFAFAIAALLGGRARRHLGALVAAVDDGRLDVPHHRHRARQLVGLLRARLGRLVVLGSGGERVVHAVAGRHRADSFARRHRKARQLQELDRAAGDLRVLA